MPGEHRDNTTRRKLESQRVGVTGNETPPFGWSSDQIRLFSDSGMHVYGTGKLPPPLLLCRGVGAKRQGWSLFYHTHLYMQAYQCIPYASVHAQMHTKTDTVPDSTVQKASGVPSCYTELTEPGWRSLIRAFNVHCTPSRQKKKNDQSVKLLCREVPFHFLMPPRLMAARLHSLYFLSLVGPTGLISGCKYIRTN